MNIKLFGAFLAALTMSGCIINSNGGGGHTPPPPPKPGDVTLAWTFKGGTCFDVPDVKTIVVNIPGEVLANEGAYPCSANNFPGIVLHDFAPSTYSFTIDAFDYGNKRIFVGSGTFTVNGDVRVDIDLSAVGGASSSAYLNWRFPANQASQNPTCSQAGVAFVDVSIDGSAWDRVVCEDGFGAASVLYSNLLPGTHDLSLVAVNADGYPYYRVDGQLQTFVGKSVAVEYDLNWAVGGTAISWAFTDGSAANLSCAQAGVTTVYVNFIDSRGNWVYGDDWDVQPCDGTPVRYDYLLPGTYEVYLEGSNGSQITYLSSESNPPVVTIQAGVFASELNPLAIQMFRN